MCLLFFIAMKKDLKFSFSTKYILWLFFIALSGCISTQNENNIPYDYKVKVVSIVDGDTFKGLTEDSVQIKFRIYGIDAPEKNQPFGNKSKEYLSSLIFGKKVKIKTQTEKDYFKRPVVFVFTPDNKDVSAEMLKAGMAWHFTKYDKTQKYANLESTARKKKTGLWQDKNPIEPWNFRKSKKRN